MGFNLKFSEELVGALTKLGKKHKLGDSNDMELIIREAFYVLGLLILQMGGIDDLEEVVFEVLESYRLANQKKPRKKVPRGKKK